MKKIWDQVCKTCPSPLSVLLALRPSVDEAILDSKGTEKETQKRKLSLIQAIENLRDSSGGSGKLAKIINMYQWFVESHKHGNTKQRLNREFFTNGVEVSQLICSITKNYSDLRLFTLLLHENRESTHQVVINTISRCIDLEGPAAFLPSLVYMNIKKSIANEDTTKPFLLRLAEIQGGKVMSQKLITICQRPFIGMRRIQYPATRVVPILEK